MKKFKFLSVLAIVLLCSGCMKYTIGMNIDSDKNVNFELIYALDKEAWGEMLDETEITETDNEMIEAGYEVKPYNEGKWVGSVYSKNMGNLDNISTTDGINVDLSNIFDDENQEPIKYYFQKKVDGKKTTYIASFTIDATDDETSEDEDFDMSSLTSSMELTYSVTLPVKADSNNATTVSEDGKTLTWNLEYGKVTNINYQFTLGSNSTSSFNSTNSNNTTLYIILGCAGVVIIGTVAVIVINSKKKKNITTL